MCEYIQGRYPEARARSHQAKQWIKYAIITGVVVIFIEILAQMAR
jgi:hypothetical protein